MATDPAIGISPFRSHSGQTTGPLECPASFTKAAVFRCFDDVSRAPPAVRYRMALTHLSSRSDYSEVVSSPESEWMKENELTDGEAHFRRLAFIRSWIVLAASKFHADPPNINDSRSCGATDTRMLYSSRSDTWGTWHGGFDAPAHEAEKLLSFGQAVLRQAHPGTREVCPSRPGSTHTSRRCERRSALRRAC